ncbi:MAG: hypothetical protein IIX81_00545, partial [Tidjanibacter sp.]|nr:hypothetical protein [Tidjanibacter sp.]
RTYIATTPVYGNTQLDNCGLIFGDSLFATKGFDADTHCFTVLCNELFERGATLKMVTQMAAQTSIFTPILGYKKRWPLL